jgi:hypothetical protein
LEQGSSQIPPPKYHCGIKNVNVRLRRMIGDGESSEEEDEDKQVEDVGMEVTSARQANRAGR